MKTLAEMLAEAIHLNSTKLFGHKPRHEQPLFDNFQEMLVEHHPEFAHFMQQTTGGESVMSVELFGALVKAYSFGALSALTILQNGLVVKDENGHVVDRAYYSMPELISEADSLFDPQAAVVSLNDELDELRINHNPIDYPDDEEEEGVEKDEVGLEYEATSGIGTKRPDPTTIH